MGHHDPPPPPANGASPATQVNVLGPLEVVHQRREVALGGPTQRTIIGYLLLHRDEVVAVSQLISALWRENPPTTARKVVQNSVSRLRHVLGPNTGIQIETRAPGYVLTLTAADMDVVQFQSFAAEGHTAGSAQGAAAAWGKALALWRGRPLADVVDSAFVEWPELRQLQNSRLDVLEDYCSAQLACGRHESILGELRAATAAEPQRERLLILLMHALYRSGRPAEALSAFEHARVKMIDRLGLEPSRALRMAQNAVLEHDDTMLWGTTLTGSSYPREAVTKPTAGISPELAFRTERRTVTVVLLKADIRPDCPDLDNEDLDNTLIKIDSLVRTEIAWQDGIVSFRAGSLWGALFGASGTRCDDARRAVLAALAIKHRVNHIRIAIATGESLVRHSSTAGSLPAIGEPVEQCHALLTTVATGEIRVTKETRLHSAGKIAYSPAGDGDWLASGISTTATGQPATAFVGRERELATLVNLVNSAAHHDLPRVIQIIGDAGIGKTRLIDELRRTITENQVTATVVVRAPTAIGRTLPDVLVAGLVACCGIHAHDDLATAEAKLWHTVARPVSPGSEGDHLFASLRPLLAGKEVDDPDGTLAAWWRLVELSATTRRIALVIDDIDTAHQSLAENVVRLTWPTGTAALLVIVTSSPDLRGTPSRWGGESARLTRQYLNPLPENTIRSLVSDRLTTFGATDDQIDRITALSLGNPTFAVEYCQLLTLHDHEPPPLMSTEAAALGLPNPVRQALSAQLDALPVDVRRVVLYAAVVGDIVWTGSVAAAADLEHTETSHTLESLVRAGVLVHNPASVPTTDSAYTFRYPPLRYVAYARIPRSQRDEIHRRVVSWLDRQPADRIGQLRSWYRTELRKLGMAAGCGYEELTCHADERIAKIAGEVSDLRKNHLMLATSTAGVRLRVSPR